MDTFDKIINVLDLMQMRSKLDELSMIVNQHIKEPYNFSNATISDKLRAVVELHNGAVDPKYRVELSKGNLFDVVVTNRRGIVVKRFLKYADNAEQVAADFANLNQQELADGDAPLIPADGSYSVGVVEFEHPSGFSEV